MCTGLDTMGVEVTSMGALTIMAVIMAVATTATVIMAAVTGVGVSGSARDGGDGVRGGGVQ